MIVLFAALFVSVAPAVEQPSRPTAADIAAARDVWGRLKDPQRGNGPVEVELGNAALNGLAALASDATGAGRFHARVAGGQLTGQASIALPAGLWINASATMTGEHHGFPAFSPRIGRLTFPQFTGRWGAEAGRWLLHLAGADIPPLEQMFRRVKVGRDDIVAWLAPPKDSGLFERLVKVGGNTVDAPMVREIYCRLAEQQRHEPVRDLSGLVRRAFAAAPDGTPDEHSRAALVALSLLVAGEPAKRVTPDADTITRDCARPTARVLLQQRADLAMHWTLSAGLVTVLGERAATSLGEWKELHDSLGNGSGFSFVDLAADRAGMQTALRALNSGTAAATMRELRAAEEDDLLPPALLQVPEGLSQDAFVDRFGSLDRDRYRNAVAAIDRTLAGHRAARAQR